MNSMFLGHCQSEDGFIGTEASYNNDATPPHQPLVIQQQNSVPRESAAYVVVNQPQRTVAMIYPRRHTNYTIPSILACLFCCWPLGLAAVIHANKANERAAVGDYERAERSAIQARNLLITSIIVGIVVTAFYIIIYVAQFNAAQQKLQQLQK
ncbi:uncharacterized protein LOC123558568 [Mercenaria mercenaria]|uniref:uncharacterized protein LOC123558568 n=1 Tax=Mercenaria mercenaria TaxID=6596 RepID=UPI001E1DB125|nr:uncharacterized protein LOC123558568 [Mercenaria mercenaria]